MAALSEDDVVARTLLNVLDPSREQLDLCAGRRLAALKARAPSAGSFANDPVVCASRRPAQIAVMERLSSSTISVSWSDPCCGHYTEQVWCHGLARACSRCALTGRAIRTGDRVFRPRAREIRVPVDQPQMILAEVIDHRTDLPIAGAAAIAD